MKDSTQMEISLSTAVKWASDLGVRNVVIILKIIGCLPVTSCEAERFFSKLAYLKTDLRSTIDHDRYVLCNNVIETV